jgi:hypothetical protein
MCPQNKTRGRIAHISKPATSGTQNSGEPKAHEGGKTLTPEQPPKRQEVALLCLNAYNIKRILLTEVGG